jgi:intein-encoded DNA endonuclease-like protein
MEISWQYIAGFFDGEGCVYFRKMKKPYVNLTPLAQMTQKVKQGEVLFKIKEFLKKNGIPSNIQYKKNNLTFVLTIRGGREGTFKFLQKIFPYSIVKREKIKETIEFLKKSEFIPSVFTRYFKKVVANRKQLNLYGN